MLSRWVSVHRRLFKGQEWQRFPKYSTRKEEIESILRSEMRYFKKEVTGKLLERNRFLLEIQPVELKKSFQALRKLNFPPSDIQIHPSLLIQSDHQLINNFQRLREVGFLEVTAQRLANVRKIMSRSVHFNQCFNFLPSNINVLQNIFSVANVPFQQDAEYAYDRDMKLEAVHRMALRQYMLNHIDLPSPHIDELWHLYPGLRTRSLQSIDKAVKILEQSYRTKIMNLPKYILLMQPEEIEELLQVGKFCDVDVRDIMTLGPKCNLSRIKHIQIICWSYRIPDYALAYCPKLFFVNFDTLRDRLDTIAKLKRADEFFQHAAIGKVIVSMDRIKAYVKTKKMDFDAIFDDTFVDFFLNGFMFPKSNPSLFYLCDVFKKTEDEIKEALSVHPHSKRYSFPVIQQNIEYLLSQGFTTEDIFNVLYIILYSINEIEEFFDRLRNPSEMKILDIDPKRLTESQKLRLCVYTIEKKCNFNGDGIFLNSHAAEFNDEESWRMEEIIRQTFLYNVRLVYCDTPASGTCCSKNMEIKLASYSRNQLERNTKELVGKLASVLSTRATRFNDFFKTLLSNSKTEFHDMFKRTYGVIYEQNAYVFSDLFTDLESYYIRGKVDLTEALDSFFNVLYQKMFTVLNSQYKFDDKYLGCVSEHMKQLKPFGDVPEKLTGQVKRSFVATRTFEQALTAAAEVARNMAIIRPGADCTSALTKMQQCGTCRGFVEKPCSNYCVNVMRGCMNNYLELDIEWDNFVASMDKIIERLLGPFNIVMVVEPINIKISEAIMNFQETGHDISAQIFNGCGKPQLNPKQRRRRSVSPRLLLSEKKYFDDISNRFSDDESSDMLSFVDDMGRSYGDSQDESNDFSMNRIIRSKRQTHPSQTERASNRDLTFEPLQFDGESEEEVLSSSNKGRRKNKNNGKNGGNSGSRGRNDDDDDDDDDNKEAPLDNLVRDIRNKVKDSKKFWSNLPYQICNNEEVTASQSNDMNCWNGNRIDRYPHMISSDLSSNPEFSSQSSGRRTATFDAQLFALKNAVVQLRNAYNGHDVEWADVEEGGYYGSGSVSGGGSIEDNEEEGSGIGAIDYTPGIHEQGPSTTHSVDPTIDIDHGSVDSPTSKSDKETKTRIDDSESNNINKIDSNSVNNKETGSGAIGTKPQMSLKRALFTYFLPIYLAWFGGLFSELL